jgi:hypothetical protein
MCFTGDEEKKNKFMKQSIFDINIPQEDVPQIISGVGEIIKELLEKSVRDLNLPNEIYLKFLLLQVIWVNFNRYLLEILSQNLEKGEVIEISEKLMNSSKDNFYKILQEKTKFSKEKIISNFLEKNGYE